MKNRSLLALCLFTFSWILSGCGGDPNVEGAKLNIANKEWDKALVNLDKAIATNPANADAWKYKGQVYYQMSIGQRDSKLRNDGFTNMAEAFAKAKAAGAAAQEINVLLKGAWGSQVNRAVSHLNKRNADSTLAAIEVLKNANALIDTTISIELLGQAYYRLKENNPDAIAPLQLAISKGHKEEVTFDMLARTLINNDRPADAIPVLEAAQAAFPNNTNFEDVKIEAYKLAGQTDKALSLYKGKVTADPDNVDARLRYGNLLLQTGSFDEATQQLEAAYALDTDNDDILYNLGIAYYNKAVGMQKEREGASTQRAIEIKRDMDALFNKSFPFLEKAREINTTAGKDSENTPICKALFGIYANIGQQAKANAVMSCAGM